MNKIIRKTANIVSRFLTDECFVKILYKRSFHKPLNLSNPVLFNEKIQYLKLYDRNPLYTVLSDKCKAKAYVSSLIGEEYIIPTIGVWKRFKDIDFDSLPDKFVLKCNHDSGSVFICKNKKNFDVSAVGKKIKRNLKKNFYYYGREWSYKNIPPLILAEELIEGDNQGDGLVDYKFYCFNGVADCVMVCLDRQIGDTKFYFFDKQWKLKRINERGKSAPLDFYVEKPPLIDRMFEIAEKLSKGIPFVRIDLYQSNNHIYFGEFTFYPSNGVDSHYLPETELYFGNLIGLDKVFSKRRK